MACVPQIMFDTVTRRPRLEDADIPFVTFCQLAEREGLDMRLLQLPEAVVTVPCSTSIGLDKPGALQLLAFSRSRESLAALPE